MDSLHPVSIATSNAPMGGQMSRETFIHANIVYGLSLEVAIHGLVTLFLKLTSSDVRNGKKFRSLAVLLVMGNVSAIIYVLGCVYRGSFVESNCVGLSIVTTLASHLFYFSFDAVILFKCYHLTNKNKYVTMCIWLILANRVGWIISDMVLSYGFWIPDFAFCAFSQDPITGPGSNISDIISDCFATLTALVITFFRFSLSSRYIQVMVLRTILRSLLVVAMNILVMYMNIEPPNPFWHFFAWNLRAYVLLRMLNLDILLDLGEIKESTRSGSDSDGRKSGSTQQPLVVPSSSQIFKAATMESRRASRIVKG